MSEIDERSGYQITEEPDEPVSLFEDLDEGVDASNDTVDFTEGTDYNLVSGSKLSVLFGKLKKLISSLARVAFSGSYNDLSDTPDIPELDLSATASAVSGTTAGANVAYDSETGELTFSFTLPKGDTGDTGSAGPSGTSIDATVIPNQTHPTIPGVTGSKVVLTPSDGGQSTEFYVWNGKNGVDGQNGRDGRDGQAGQDAVSPIINFTDITGGKRITVIDADGIKTTDVENGSDGHSISADISSITDGNRVTIYQDGIIIGGFDVENGKSSGISSTPVRNSGGDIIGYLITLQDGITGQTTQFTLDNGVNGATPQCRITYNTWLIDGHYVTGNEVEFYIDNGDGTETSLGTFICLNGEGGSQGADGISPEVETSSILNGTRVTITDAFGSHSFDVMNGSNGISPEVTVSEITGGHEVYIRDYQGDHRFNVMDGTDGSNGISPSVDYEYVTGGVEVTITDADGDHTFRIMDGINGQDGSDGVTPSITALASVDSNTGVPAVNVSKSGTDASPTFTFAFSNLKGADGSNGVTPSITALASVDNNTGVPAVNVTKSGTDASPTFTFEFSNLKGANGSNGVGIPSGGTTGQFLVKHSNTDYDTEWVTVPSALGNGF